MASGSWPGSTGKVVSVLCAASGDVLAIESNGTKSAIARTQRTKSDVLRCDETMMKDLRPDVFRLECLSTAQNCGVRTTVSA